MIKTHKLGKLRIYLTTGEQVKSKKSALQRLFPKATYRHFVMEAKKAGIMNASVFPTHSGYSNGGKVEEFSAELGTAKMTICVELIDERAKLETFFSTHNELLRGKVVVFKEVEFWDVE